MRRRSVRFFQANHLRQLLGLNPGKLPKDERCWSNVEGLNFHLLPYVPQSRYSSRPHRLLVQCNCGEWMSAGRLNQHQGTHRDSISALSERYLKEN